MLLCGATLRRAHPTKMNYRSSADRQWADGAQPVNRKGIRNLKSILNSRILTVNENPPRQWCGGAKNHSTPHAPREVRPHAEREEYDDL
jgi:hypothetical protein